MNLLYINWDVSPIIFDNGLPLRWYGIFLVIGFAIAAYLFRKMVVKEGMNADLSDAFIAYTVLWTMVGLRIGHCIFYDWAYFSNHFIEIFIPFVQTPDGWEFSGYQGLASHGGTIAIIFYVLYFSRKHKVNLLWLLDRLALCIPIAAAFVRCGNLMNSEIIGTITDMPWGFVFMQLAGTNECCEPRHPAQLYEASVYLLLFVYQMWYYFMFTKGKVPAGRAVGTLLVVIFTARFFIEFFKADQVAFEANMTLNMGQWLSLPFIVLGIFCLVYSVVKKTISTPHYSTKKR